VTKGFPIRLEGAFQIASTNENFGGLSAIHASGNSLTMVSDKGTLIRIGVDEHSPVWRGTIALLPSRCGNMQDKGQRDIESLAADPQSGAIWIGFEARNAICRIANDAGGGTKVAYPRFMAHWNVASGPEAMVRMRDGRFLVFQEMPDNGTDMVEVLGYTGDPVRTPDQMTIMKMPVIDGYLPVDAAELPDGRLLLLTRNFNLPFAFTNRLYLMPRPQWRDDEQLKLQEVMRITSPRIADNFEGIAIDPAGDRINIWLVSDDNFLNAQRSILLRLSLPNAG
jgi:hypothetical protein